jgi:uncharacterized protein
LVLSAGSLVAALEIIRFADLTATPWKNGGGVTREILRHEKDGAIVWRLSIADVSSEGPFSVFAGLQRILTVIEGEGMRLVHLDGSALLANLFSPVAFSGEEPITGELPSGPCRDFNIIWNPSIAEASVSVIAAGQTAASGFSEFSGILCLSQRALISTGETLAFGDLAVLNEPAILKEGKALLLIIRGHSHP